MALKDSERIGGVPFLRIGGEQQGAQVSHQDSIRFVEFLV
jgi:hypothetical protein